MRGVNFTSPRQHAMVRALIDRGEASFCEILIDNFLGVTPESVRKAFPDIPIAFHIMQSRFLHRSEPELRALAGRLRPFVERIRPMYVSDHLALFQNGTRQLPALAEIDYESQINEGCVKLSRWQEMLGSELYIENFPSVLPIGRTQPEFLAALTKRTGTKVLFDFSNAVVAKLNCGLSLDSWRPIIRSTNRFHAAGYRATDTTPPIIRDSHDCALSPETIDFIHANLPDTSNSSLVVERDDQHDLESWATDLRRTKWSLQ